MTKKKFVRHLAFWSPLAWWSYRCDPHPHCKDCRIKPGWDSFEMEGSKDCDLKKVTCWECRKRLPNASTKESNEKG